jgi:hypothetical protein
VHLCVVSLKKVLIDPGESLTETITKNVPWAKIEDKRKAKRGKQQTHFVGKDFI